MNLPGKKSPSISELEQALKTCAKIVVLYGETYYPLFERLERELEQAQKMQQLHNRAKAVLQKDKRTKQDDKNL